MPSKESSTTAADDSTVKSNAASTKETPRVTRPNRIFPIPVRLPAGVGKAGDHTTPPERSVTPKPATILEAKGSSIDTFGRTFCETSKTGKTANFIAAHIGAPCTMGALDHHLSCGHKILADQPEPCASNCKHMPGNDRHTGSNLEPFVCMTCIIDDVRARHNAKVEEFRSEMEAIAAVARKDLERDELTRRLEVIEIGWQELDLKVIRERVACGRWSQPFYVDPAYSKAVGIIARDHIRSGFEKTRSTSSTSSSSVQRGPRGESSAVASMLSSRSSSPASSASAMDSKARHSRMPKRP